MGIKYNTPFVGLFLFSPDYLKLLENLDHYLSYKLSFTKKSKWITQPAKYPIGLLDDIEIHFMHYKDNSQALSKWNRRLDRMKKVTDRDKYYFKICDRDFSSEEIISKFHDLPFKNKISFGLTKLNKKNHFQIKENKNSQSVPDGLKLYRYSYKYIDVLKWIDTGESHKNLYSKLKYKINIL